MRIAVAVVLFVLINQRTFAATTATTSPPTLHESRLNEVSNSNAWLRLLHYKPRWITGTNRSLNDGPGFFFSPKGAQDALEELKETIKAFWDDKQVGNPKQHSQCAFPLRLKYLKKELGIDPPKVECAKLNEFLTKFKAQSASLIFSSATPNNPASMFGHTFVKINSGSNSELLDWGINFAASVTDDENPLTFMVYGLAGGYVGQYSMLPYFQKVNEYTNLESRDLWEYELSLTKVQTEELLMHLWELETNGFFAYYFFDENCSYQLLAAIEAVRPDWNLTDFPLYAIPGETVKKVTETPGAVRKVRFRPSLQKQLKWAYSKLSTEEQKQFLLISKTRSGAEKVQSPLLLNALAIDYLYGRHRAGGKPPPEEILYQSKLLERRSQFPPGDMVQVDEIPSETRPDLGHDSYRMGMWSGYFRRPQNAVRDQGFLELSWKSAYHDLLNKDLGYSRLSHIDFPALDLRYNIKDQSLSIEKVTGIEATSIFPLSLVERRLSWKFSTYSYNPRDFGCDYCHAVHMDGGVGVSAELGTSDLVGFAMAVVQMEIADSFSKGYRYGPGVYAGMIWTASENTKLLLSGYHWWDVDQQNRLEHYTPLSFDASYALSRNWELRVGVQKLLHSEAHRSDYEQVQFKINKYFN